ncbi:MAG: hypothetical protein KBC64_02210 [Simkaniaceae bacterium]|nr:hypothetical protein [Simkaniaceae bacterium]
MISPSSSILSRAGSSLMSPPSAGAGTGASSCTQSPSPVSQQKTISSTGDLAKLLLSNPPHWDSLLTTNLDTVKTLLREQPLFPKTLRDQACKLAQSKDGREDFYTPIADRLDRTIRIAKLLSDIELLTPADASEALLHLKDRTSLPSGK